MGLLKLTPMIWTDQFKETIDFYTTHLGFDCVSMDADLEWAAMQRDNIELMISRPNEHTPFEKPTFTGTFYFVTDDAQELWQQLKDQAKIVYPLEDFEWQMREFAIYDNNGYMLQFGQDISTGEE